MSLPVSITINWLTGGVPTSISVKYDPSPIVCGKISADMKLGEEEAMVGKGSKCNNIMSISIVTDRPKWLQKKAMMYLGMCERERECKTERGVLRGRGEIVLLGR
jgi:hypothetical protein